MQSFGLIVNGDNQPKVSIPTGRLDQAALDARDLRFDLDAVRLVQAADRGLSGVLVSQTFDKRLTTSTLQWDHPHTGRWIQAVRGGQYQVVRWGNIASKPLSK